MLKRKKPLRRSAFLSSGRASRSRRRGIAGKNAGRRAREFERAYGGAVRVEWVAAMGCYTCGSRPSENAHTVTGGMGRKADAATIIPLCRTHHTAYDQHRPPFDTDTTRAAAQAFAAYVDHQWQAHCRATPTPTRAA